MTGKAYIFCVTLNRYPLIKGCLVNAIFRDLSKQMTMPKEL